MAQHFAILMFAYRDWKGITKLQIMSPFMHFDKFLFLQIFSKYQTRTTISGSWIPCSFSKTNVYSSRIHKEEHEKHLSSEPYIVSSSRQVRSW